MDGALIDENYAVSSADMASRSSDVKLRVCMRDVKIVRGMSNLYKSCCYTSYLMLSCLCHRVLP